MASIVPAAAPPSEGRTILLAVDDSPGSNAAFNFTINQVARPSDKLVLLHVCPEIDVDVFYGTPSYIEEVERQLTQAGDALLSRFLDVAATHNLVAEGKMVKGDAREKVVEIAEKLKVDLVIVGSRGLGTLSRALLGSVSDYIVNHRALLGSVSDYIVNHSTSPVLVVRPPKPTRDNEHGPMSLFSGINKVGRIVETGM
eukprot:TRINITY_DN163_c0_g1_i2.p1 TRINITY_DN163_c0_g1~~TRINITY_DN163_c0_g1_i2.p1  ORF type:complete len:199 (-),score=41.71 TRINITY_DN163_c0_g1_i2:257-853(-)